MSIKLVLQKWFPACKAVLRKKWNALPEKSHRGSSSNVRPLFPGTPAPFMPYLASNTHICYAQSRCLLLEPSPGPFHSSAFQSWIACEEGWVLIFFAFVVHSHYTPAWMRETPSWKKKSVYIYIYIYILLLLGRMFCICMLGPFGPWCCSCAVLILIFFLDGLLFIDSEILRSPTTIVLLSIAPFWSAVVCLEYLGVPMHNTTKKKVYL